MCITNLKNKMTKTHTIMGKRKGKIFTKQVEIIYDHKKNRPQWIKNLFGHTGYIEYKQFFDSNNKYLGDSKTPEPIVKSYREIFICEDFKIIK